MNIICRIILRAILWTHNMHEKISIIFSSKSPIVMKIIFFLDISSIKRP